MSDELAVLEANAVSHRYGDFDALTSVSFALRSGTTALVGVNGAGKTTLLSALCGGRKPTSGGVRIMGQDPYRLGQRKDALGRVALMPQQVTFPPNLTALEVVSLLGWMRGMRHRHARAKAEEVLERVGLRERARHQVKQLSGGMVRRVALAQALVSEPDVLLLDEPSTGLDPEQRRLMVQLVQRLDAAVLFSSHIIEDVEEVADRVLVLEDGRLLFDGPVSELAQTGARGAADSGRRSPVEAGFLRVVTEQRRSAQSA